MTRTPAPTTASSVAPPPETASTGLAARLTSRWGARVAVLLFVLATILVSGAMRSAEVPPRGDSFPASAESAVVAERLATFRDAGRAPVLLVGTRNDGGRLTSADVAAMATLGERPQRSADGKAVVVTRDVTLGADGSQTADAVKEVRADVAAASPDGLTVQVTGGPAFGADLASSFDGANVTLLLVTIGVVALLLLLTYRSPILWILPLLVVAVADQVAGRVTAAVGDASGLSFDAGIISVLVFGAGTNYALLLISRYRDELRARTPITAPRSRWRGAARSPRSSRATSPSSSPSSRSCSPRSPGRVAWASAARSASSPPSVPSSSSCPGSSRWPGGARSGRSSPAPVMPRRTPCGVASPVGSSVVRAPCSPAGSPCSPSWPPASWEPGWGCRRPTPSVARRSPPQAWRRSARTSRPGPPRR